MPHDPSPARPAAPLPSVRRGRRPRRSLRIAAVAAGALAVLVAAALLWGWSRLRASLPIVEGEVAVAGLGAPVVVERDGLGIPTIRGESRLDVARATGFVHAQDRFFQMDLYRRQPAGELAELVGPGALPADRAVRVHRFRHRAEALAAALSEADRALLAAYAEGVAAGLGALGAPPFEYLVLGADPAPWRPADTLLVLYAMYLDLHDEDASHERGRQVIADALGEETAAFLVPATTEWDAALPPVAAAPEAAPPPPPIPGPAPPPTAGPPARSSPGTGHDRPASGSNNFALAGEHTADGGALLAGDMHLPHAVPNVWYRASLVFPDPGAPSGTRRVTGVTLPGTPVMVAGSNGEVAWAFTNTYADWFDLVVVEPVPGDPARYRTPDGPRPYERHREVLRAADGSSEELEVVETIWGPLLADDHRGRPLALSWLAHHPQGANFGLIGMERAGTVDEAVEVANRSGIPPQNLLVADAQGRIAWTVVGAIPRRRGFDGSAPVSWADGTRGWDGFLEPAEYPRRIDPPEGRLWTANARVASGEELELLGDGGYALGARARQIRDRLRQLDDARPEDLLAIQLDDRALLLERWRRLLLDVLDERAVADRPDRAELRRLVEETWTGRASADSAGYRLVRAFRAFFSERVLDPWLAPARALDPSFEYPSRQGEEPLWRLVTERPGHLVPAGHGSWEEVLLAAADDVTAHFAEGGPLAERTWGERNTVAVRHPLSPFLPGFLSRWLDMPARELPGDLHMPRYQAPGEGASQRMVVSPGREEEGIFHMPTGQSGHPLSPHYGDAHEAWAEGRPTPFLPGETVHELRLVGSR